MTAPARTADLRALRTYALVAIVVWLGRWWFNGDRRVTHISPDEPSQLAVARWLAGGRWNMFDHATWQPGFGTLLSPVYWFTDHAETVVRSALALNALIGGLAAAVFTVLVRRLTDVSLPVAALVATVVGLTPASLSASAFLWAEPLVSLTFTGGVLLLLRAHDTGRWQPAVGAIVVSVAGYTSHGRLLAFVGSTVLVTVGVALWQRRWRRAGGYVAIALASLAVSHLYTRWLLDRIWDDPTDQNTVGAVWRRAQKPVEVAEAVLGQAWYQLAASFGLFGLGTIVVIAALFRRGHALSDGLDAVAARVLVVSLVPQLALSAVFMSDRTRSDQLIYGRYNDAVVWPVLALGLVWVGRRFVHGARRPEIVSAAAVLVALVGTGIAVDALHRDAIRESYGVRSMIPGLLAFVDGEDVLDVRRVTVTTATVFATLLIAVAIAQVRDARPLIAGVVVTSAAVLFAVGLTRTERVADLRLNGWLPASEVRAIDEIVPAGAVLGVHTVPDSQDPVIDWVPQRQRYQLYQLFLPHRTFLRDRGLGDDVGPYVFAPLRDPELVDAGAEVVWSDPRARIGLWQEPG